MQQDALAKLTERLDAFKKQQTELDAKYKYLDSLPGSLISFDAVCNARELFARCSASITQLEFAISLLS